MQKYSDVEDTDKKPVKGLVIAGTLFQQNSTVHRKCNKSKKKNVLKKSAFWYAKISTIYGKSFSNAAIKNKELEWYVLNDLFLI